MVEQLKYFRTIVSATLATCAVYLVSNEPNQGEFIWHEIALLACTLTISSCAITAVFATMLATAYDHRSQYEPTTEQTDRQTTTLAQLATASLFFAMIWIGAVAGSLYPMAGWTFYVSAIGATVVLVNLKRWTGLPANIVFRESRGEEWAPDDR